MTSSLYDIAIVGGGSAGVAAAVGAARSGARVCVIERSSTLGGNASEGMVGTICGLSICGESAPSNPTYDNPGFATQFAQEVAIRSGSRLQTNERGLTYLPYREGIFEEVCALFVQRVDGVTPYTAMSVTAIERSNVSRDFLIHARSLSSQHSVITAKAVIDASGNAVVSSLLGIPFQEPIPPQASALVFELADLPALDEGALGFALRRILREATLEGALEESLSYVSIVPGSLHDGRVLCKLGSAPLPTSAHEDEERMAREVSERGITDLLACLRSRSPLFESTRHSMTAPRLGVRGGRRGVGEIVLDDDAVLFSRPHPEGVALGFWPVELWDTPARPELQLPEGLAYEIPAGSLRSRHAPGVYFAGRTISATDRAIASARVIGTCLSTGYAAGKLAVADLRGEPRSSTVSRIRVEQVEPFLARGEQRYDDAV